MFADWRISGDHLRAALDLSTHHVAMAVDARVTWAKHLYDGDAAARDLAYRCGELATADWLRQPGGCDFPVRVPELLADQPDLAAPFKAGVDHIMEVNVVLWQEQIIVPTGTGSKTATFWISRNVEGTYQAHWGWNSYPPAFGENFCTYAEAEEAFRNCWMAFLEATMEGECATLFGIPVPRYEVTPKCWPALDHLEV